MSYVYLILQALANLTKWMAIEAEIRAKTLLRDEIQKVTDASIDLQNKILKLRTAGNPDADALADRLHEQCVALTVYRQALPTIPPVSESKPASADNTGNLSASK